MPGKREFGDYQTPREFAKKVCLFLRDTKSINVDLILEPTCGKGSFLEGATIFNANRIIGVEINKEYCDYCVDRIDDSRVEIINADFFTTDFSKLLPTGTRALIIGNPPWVTNSDLSAHSSRNLPRKVNFKNLKAFDALTGASNFDICESIILRMVELLRDTDSFIAMLCKTSVARNIFEEASRIGVNFSSFEIYEFDANKVFNVSVNACLLFIELSKKTCAKVCRVHDFIGGEKPKSIWEYSNGRLVPLHESHFHDLDGECEFIWRQGIKHDCSTVMELTYNEELKSYVNGAGEECRLEDDFVFPLVKSSMFKRAIISAFNRFVIVPQKKLRDDTSVLQTTAPQTWRYLNDNLDYFQKRKSSIYQNAPQFSVFGVGDYSFARYKVGVSGFYKNPLFSLIYTEDGKPVMLDDTCYYLSFDNFNEAYIVMLLLNSEVAQGFLSSIAFLDSKRPYTKKVLARLDFRKLLRTVNYRNLRQTETDLGLPPLLHETAFNVFQSQLAEKVPRTLTLF